LKEYVAWDYHESADQFWSKAKERRRKIFENLKDAYPDAKTPLRIWEDIREDTGMADSTVYEHIKMLKRSHFIHELNERQRKEAISKNKIRVHKNGNYDAAFYIVEQADSIINLLSRHEDPKKRMSKYMLAPGYVEYDEKFSKAWDALLLVKEDTLKNISKDIVNLLKAVLPIIAEDIETKEVAPSIGYSSKICTNCGINHEGRSFLRAVMLKLLDYTELGSEYRDFLNEMKILDDRGYEHYKDAGEYNEKVLRSISEEKAAVKVIGGYNDQIPKPPAPTPVPPSGAVWMRIITVSKEDKETNFLALSNDGNYVWGTIDNTLRLRDMKEGTLIEYTGPIEPHDLYPNGSKITVMEDTGMKKDSMKILKDDGSIADREKIPIDSISNIKVRRKIYRVFASIVSIEDSPLSTGQQLRIKDGTGEILYHVTRPTGGIARRLNVGDKIDLIGTCWISDVGIISLGFILVDADVIRLRY
jgi:hypothetical protein